MDIKTSQATQTANSAVGSPDQRQPFWSYLTVRTMKQDLAALVPKAPAAVLTPAAKAPAMAGPSLPQVSRAAGIEKKEEKAKKELLRQQKKLEKERLTKERKAHQKELSQIYSKAKSLLATKSFKEAITELQKITSDKTAGWWLKWKAKYLISKAQKALKAPAAAVKAMPPAPPWPKVSAAAKKKEEVAKEKLARLQIREFKDKLTISYESTKLLMAAKKFDEVIAKLRQITSDPQASWWLKWRAGRLLRKVQKLLITPIVKKEEKPAVPRMAPWPRPVISPLIGSVSPGGGAPALQPIKAAGPPPSLPTAKPMPAPELKPEEEAVPISPAPPAPPAKPSLTAAPKPVLAEPKPAPAVMSEWVASLGQPPAGSPKSELAWKKIILIGAILAAVFFSVGLWFIWPKGGQPISPSPSVSPSISVLPSASLSPSPSPSELPLALPAVLFKMDKKAVIELAATEDNLAGQKLVQQFSQSSEPAGSFTQIIFQTNQAPASFDRVVSMLNLDFLNGLVSSASTTASYKVSTSTPNGQTDLEQNPFSPNLPKCGAGEKCRDDVSPFKDFYLESDQSFSLFVYTQAPLSASPFSGSQNEGRLGLIAKFKDSADLAGAIKDLKNFEPSLLKSAGALFLGKNINLSAADSFSDNDYLGIAIRYVNLAGPELSFDYAIVEKMLLIATSKESMYAAINRILTAPNEGSAPTESINCNDTNSFKNPANTVECFSSALKTNNETTASNLFADKENNLNEWRSLTPEEKNFLGTAIKEGVSIPNISADQTIINTEVKMLDSKGNIIKGPLVLIQDADGNWKIETW